MLAKFGRKDHTTTLWDYTSYLNRLNLALSKLTGSTRRYGRLSSEPEFDHIDGGRDDVMNRIIWFATKGKQPYPSDLTGPADNDD